MSSVIAKLTKKGKGKDSPLVQAVQATTERTLTQGTAEEEYFRSKWRGHRVENRERWINTFTNRPYPVQALDKSGNKITLPRTSPEEIARAHRLQTQGTGELGDTFPLNAENDQGFMDMDTLCTAQYNRVIEIQMELEAAKAAGNPMLVERLQARLSKADKYFVRLSVLTDSIRTEHYSRSIRSKDMDVNAIAFQNVPIDLLLDAMKKNQGGGNMSRNLG